MASQLVDWAGALGRHPIKNNPKAKSLAKGGGKKEWALDMTTG
jgi:hypothetical protein